MLLQVLCLVQKTTASDEVLRIATLTISLMLKRNNKLGIAHLIQPFLHPLEKLVNGEHALP